MRQKKIRLTIITDRFFPVNTASVIRLQVLKDAWLKSGFYDVKVLAASFEHGRNDVQYLRSLLPAPSNKSNRIIRLFLETALGVEYFIRLLFRKSDIFFISSPPFILALLCTWAARLRNIPYIFDVRDLYPEVYFSAGILKRNHLIGKTLSHFERQIYCKSLVNTTVTEGLVKKIQQQCEHGQTWLVRNGYIEKKMNEIKEHKFETFTVVFHGNLGEFQEINLILELAHSFYKNRKNINFLIIGEGLKADLITSIVLPNLTYSSNLEIHEVYKLISQAHLGISFRQDEWISRHSFPVKIYEYIGLLLPVIVTPISEAGEFVEKYQIGFQYQPNQINEIYHKILELAENESYMKNLIGNISNIKSLFSREKIADHFVKQMTNAIQNSLLTELL